MYGTCAPLLVPRLLGTSFEARSTFSYDDFPAFFLMLNACSPSSSLSLTKGDCYLYIAAPGPRAACFRRRHVSLTNIPSRRIPM